jgi:hypothetical protein
MSDDANSQNHQQNVRTSMDRRDLLKVLSTVPAAAMLPAGAARAAEMSMPHASMAQAAAQGKASGAYEPTAFNPHEYKTVQVLSDIIIPSDDRSGSATQARVPEFLDGWLGTQGGLDTIRGGITWLDLECNRAYGHDFIDASDSEKKQLLDRIAYPKTAAPADAPGVVFFNRMRGLVLGGFYTSKMGIEDLPYKGNQMLPEWNGCPANVLVKLGVSYDSKT